MTEPDPYLGWSLADRLQMLAFEAELTHLPRSLIETIWTAPRQPRLARFSAPARPVVAAVDRDRLGTRHRGGVSWRTIAGYLPAVLLLALGLACGDDQQGPSPDGPPFFTATIGGEPWSPDYLIAFAGADLVNLQARRHMDDGRDEQFTFYLITSDAFKPTNYRLDGDEPGESSAQFAEFPEVPDSDSLLWFVTSRGAHRNAQDYRSEHRR